jgi:hypothetical protein
MWTLLPVETSNDRKCATWNCDNEPLVRFTVEDVSSIYCAPCARRIERLLEMRIRAAERNRHKGD